MSAPQSKYTLIPLFASMTGYSVKACQRKIETGVWLEGLHYRRAPDGRLTMNVEEYYRWVEQSSRSAVGAGD